MANNYIFKVFIFFSHQRKNYIWGWENSVLRKALASQIVDLSLTPIAHPPKKMYIGAYTCEEIKELYSLVVSQFGLIFEDSEK